jgi:hypothetical protein
MKKSILTATVIAIASSSANAYAYLLKSKLKLLEGRQIQPITLNDEI